MDATPDCFVTVCGGGGLLMGILMGLKDVGWDDVPVVVAETVGADSLVGRCTCINKPTSTVWLQSRMDGGCGEGVGVVIHNL